jgi:Flp pilus assembly protein TadG
MSRNERGAAAVEFALVLPLLVLLVAGIAEFGRAYYLQATLSGAAREGARAMALTNSVAGARTAVRGATNGISLSDAQIVVAPGTGACVSTATTTLTATVTINYSTAFVSHLFGATLNLHGKGAMRCGG